MGKPRRILDLYSGAGGAAMGYAKAGFELVGVDIKPQPRYPFEFMPSDALAALDCLISGGLIMGTARAWTLDDFDAIHASPPCQAFSRITATQGDPSSHPDLLTPTRARLQESCLPWVIENVPRAPMRADYKLCGCMFGLRTTDRQLARERWFETSWHAFDLRAPCHHPDPAIGVYGYGGVRGSSGRLSGRLDRWRQAMGIDWMEAPELREAIPPAYTEYIGHQLMTVLEAAA
jgi:DNA (cytosine-5)-methyltransferase 1